jgi:hypothetical protein
MTEPVKLSRKSANGAYPEDLTLIGRAVAFDDGPRDTKHVDGQHPQWDESALQPYDEALVQLILEHGPIGSIETRRDGPDVIVVNGRRRTIAAREANRRLAEQGVSRDMQIRLTCIHVHGGEAEQLAIMAIMNHNQQPVSVLRKARLARDMLKRGMSEAEIGTKFKATAQSVKDWLAVLEANPEVIAAWQKGEMTQTDVVAEVRTKRRSEQKPRPKSTAPKRAELRRITAAPTARHELTAATLNEEPGQLLLDVLSWVAGDGQLEGRPGLKSALEQLAVKPKGASK